MLQLYRALLALRRSRPALQAGPWTPVSAADDVLVYARGEGVDRLLVLLNFGAGPATVAVPGGSRAAGSPRVLLATGLDRQGEAVGEALSLRAQEGLLIGA